MAQANDDPKATAGRRMAVDSLAREFEMPVELVERTYRDQASRIEAQARIKTFVPVVILNRVRAELRHHRRQR